MALSGEVRCARSRTGNSGGTENRMNELPEVLNFAGGRSGMQASHHLSPVSGPRDVIFLKVSRGKFKPWF